MSVLTALPIQNTCGVRNCFNLPLKAIEEQLDAIFSDITPNVIKIGMLFNQEIVHIVAEFLAKYAQNIPIVLDPVMVAKSGDYLLLPKSNWYPQTGANSASYFDNPNINEAQAL